MTKKREERFSLFITDRALDCTIRLFKFVSISHR